MLGRARLTPRPLMAQAWIEAAEHEADRANCKRLLLHELHHRMNMRPTVVGITSQTLRMAKNLDEGRLANPNRLVAMGRAQVPAPGQRDRRGAD